MQAASFYTSRFGFEYFAYKGLETGARDVCTHVLKNNSGVFLAFSSPYSGDEDEMNPHIVKHGV